MAWLKITPRFAATFRARGWDTAASFLDWTGILVNHHRRRQVEQVVLEKGEGGSFFLKKEHAVSWRERFRNAWSGFGWFANAVREAAILRAAREAGVGCPEVVAFGADGRRAFVLLRDESAMQELRTFLQKPANDEAGRALADALGRELAHLHDAGFDHPDLFAKHILVARTEVDFRVCILDWARAKRQQVVSWRSRCRALAVLDATLHAALASDRLRLHCLRAYLNACEQSPPLGRLAQQIRRDAELRRRERNILEIGQLPTPPRDQQFVQQCAGRLLVVRSYWDRLAGRLPEWLTHLSAPGASLPMSLASASGSAWLRVQTTERSSSALEIPALAHTLFRLQRFGVPAPRLLAVAFSEAQVFLVTETPAMRFLEDALVRGTGSERERLTQRVDWIVQQLRAADYHLPDGDSWPGCLGVTASTGEVTLIQVEKLQRGMRSRVADANVTTMENP